MLHAGGEFNGTHAGIGIKGYDPVAYFTTGKPVNAELNTVFRQDPAGFAARAADKWPALNR